MLLLTHPHNVHRWCQYSSKIHGSIHIWVTAHLGKTLRCLVWYLPQVFVYHLLSINCIPFLLQTSYYDGLHLFSQGVDRWGKEMALMWGSLTICPSLQQFHISSLTPAELSSLTSLKAWGESQRIHHVITFLLVLAEEEAIGDRKYGLWTIWVNPCQARVHSMEEVVKNPTALVSSGPDWPYTLVQLHKDTCHVPLPKEGHLGILPQRGTETTACGRISQLEVCQHLVSCWQVSYPIGFNGCEEPIITSLPESLANGISLTRGKSIYLEIDIPQYWQRNQTKRHCLLVSTLPS